MKQKNRCLNLMKGIGCFGIIFIHIPFPGEVGKFVFLLSRYVVPFFFMISGYYAYGTNLEENHSKIIRRAKKNLKVLIYSLIPYVVYHAFYPLGVEFSVEQVFRTLILSDFTFVNAGVLWYLHAQIIGYLFLDMFGQKKLYPKVYLIVPILLFICTYMRIRFTSTYYFNNFLLTAIPFMLVGHCIARNEMTLKKVLNNNRIVLGIVVSILFMAVRRFLPIETDLTYLGVIVYAIGMFLFAIFNPQFSVCKPLEIIGERYSMYIYVLHIIVNILIWRFFTNPWLYPIMIAVITLLISIVIHEIVTMWKKYEMRKRDL